MPPARADSRAERVAVPDGDVRPFTATARTTSIPTWRRIRSNRRLVIRRGKKAVVRHRRWNSHAASLGVIRAKRKCLALQVESCSPRLHRLARVKRVGRLRASAWVLAAGPVTTSVLLQRPVRASAGATSAEEPRTQGRVRRSPRTPGRSTRGREMCVRSAPQAPSSRHRRGRSVDVPRTRPKYLPSAGGQPPRHVAGRPPGSSVRGGQVSPADRERNITRRSRPAAIILPGTLKERLQNRTFQPAIAQGRECWERGRGDVQMRLYCRRSPVRSGSG
jgi:hypothetical protein